VKQVEMHLTLVRPGHDKEWYSRAGDKHTATDASKYAYDPHAVESFCSLSHSKVIGSVIGRKVQLPKLGCDGVTRYTSSRRISASDRT
jgi:hypothetical protein